MKDNQQEYGYQGRREQDWENRRISRQSNYGQENTGSYGNAGFSDESSCIPTSSLLSYTAI